eukprot:scaffold547230_cov19-Prasinocladus_malaysianus.AAC.1
MTWHSAMNKHCKRRRIILSSTSRIVFGCPHYSTMVGVNTSKRAYLVQLWVPGFKTKVDPFSPLRSSDAFASKSAMVLDLKGL